MDLSKESQTSTNTSEVEELFDCLFRYPVKIGVMVSITPIFKTGSKTDPSNYRGICISSCLRKLFCSILNQRLLEHVQSEHSS